jgi:hypothetical protein
MKANHYVGRLIEVMPDEEVGRGVKVNFVLEVGDRYKKEVCLECWNFLTDAMRNFNIGDNLKVTFEAESKQYKDRWYTNLKATSIIRHTEEA